jgi:Flp pilus assembly protein TadG
VSTPHRTMREEGAAAVEFAIIAPVLFMLIFGIIQFGIAWSQKEVFVQAAREGARYAAVGCESACNSGDVQQRVADASIGYQITGGPSAVQVDPDPGCSAPNTDPTVQVSWTQAFVINIPFIPQLNVNAPIEAVFRCEK